MSNFDLGIENQGSFVRETSTFTVGDQLRKIARIHPERHAVVDLGADSSYTYTELNERANRLANALRERGITPNESTVAVLSENRAETVVLLYACAKIGCLMATLNWRLEQEELIHCVDLVEPEAVFVSDRFEDKRADIDEQANHSPAFVEYDGGGDGAEYETLDGAEYETLVAEGSVDEPLPEGRVDPEQGLVAIYTSGTTGLPKAVVISHRAELARAAQVTIDYELERGDNYPGWGAQFHMAGVDWIVVEAVLAGTYYAIDGFDPVAISEILQTSPRPISWLFAVPGMVDPLIEHIESEGLSAEDFVTIRSVGGLPDLIPPEKMQRLTELLDAPYQNTYGSTEVGHATSGNKIPVGVKPTEEILRKDESPFVELKLVDEVGDDEGSVQGELAVRGPSVCSGYIGNQEANESEFEDGWFHTGDILTRNEDGTYTYVNRRKYLIKSGGENIYPAELEQVLMEHQRVDDVIVVRAPHDKWGEVPRAVVSTDSPDATLEEELLEMCDDRLAGYKQPYYLKFAEPGSFPRSSTGKIVREDVEEWDIDASERVSKE